MSIRPIRLFGDPVLRTAADPVTTFDAELRKLVKDLTDTMMDAPGLGLAAPQIGVGLRVFTYYVDDVLGHVINPSLKLSDDVEVDDEGCLSFPGLAYPTSRALGTVATGFDMHGEPITIEGTGQLARCVQHETECVLPSEWLGNGVRVTAAEAVALTSWLAGEDRRAPPEVVGRLLRVGILR